MTPTWHPLELSFEAERPPSDPYLDRALTAVFEHEGGETYEVPGFWDGGETFRVRFAPPETGAWTWRTDADDPGLRDAGSFEATPGDADAPLHEHGYLDAGDRALRHADGTPFFWLADTAWSATTRATTDEWATYLDYRADQGYNAVQVNALPQHDATRPHDRLPFGTDWDFDDPDPAYFRTLDDLVAMTHDRGMVPALVALWFDYVPDTNPDWDYVYDDRHPMTAEQADALGRYLGARYGPYGAVWLVSGDSDFSPTSLAVYRAAAEGLREACTHPVCTAHQPGGAVTPDTLNAEDWLDFHMYQSGHDHDPERPARQAREHRALDPPRPVLNGEPCYQDMYLDDPDEHFDRDEVRAAAWTSVLGGANVGVTYGALGVWPWHRDGGEFEAGDRWGVPPSWRDSLSLPAGDDYARLRRVLSEFEVAALDPRQDLLDAREPGEVAAVLPDAVLVYLPDGRDLTLRDQPAVSSFEWVDPATGDAAAVSVDGGDGDAAILAPAFDGDALLVGRR